MNYFAYGSNMSLRRLQQRVPGVRRLGAASLAGFQLRFHKIGQDGSAKCDAFHTDASADLLHGALYDIDPADKHHLDRIEGLGAGYAQREVWVYVEGKSLPAMTYVATHIDPGLKPFGWYKQHVLVGAHEMGLPLDYIGAIQTLPHQDDHDLDRHRREVAIHD